MSKIKKLLLILICLLVSFEVGSESNNLDDEDLYVIIVELEHNNKMVQNSSTNKMIFSIYYLVTYLSRFS